MMSVTVYLCKRHWTSLPTGQQNGRCLCQLASVAYLRSVIMVMLISQFRPTISVTRNFCLQWMSAAIFGVTVTFDF